MTSALNGELHVYSRPRSLTCFESGDLTGTNALIFLGGLGTGFASLDLLPRLSASLPSKWSFVQASTRSSYTGFLSSKLDETPEDLHDLEVYLRQDVGKSGRMAVMGCSKGDNDVLRVFELYDQVTTLDSVVLLVPTGGRENILRSITKKDLDWSLDVASQRMQAGKGAFPLPDHFFRVEALQGCVGMHAQVWYAITGPDGAAENFESTSSDEKLSKLFENIRKHNKNVCILTAENDEGVPPTVDKQLLMERLLENARSTAATSCGYVVPNAGHNVQEVEAQVFVVERILEFLEASRFRMRQGSNFGRRRSSVALNTIAQLLRNPASHPKTRQVAP